MAKITLSSVAAELRRIDGTSWGVERLGGNVYGVTNFDVTVTIDDGRREAAGPADVLVCRDGATLLESECVSAREVAVLVASLA